MLNWPHNYAYVCYTVLMVQYCILTSTILIIFHSCINTEEKRKRKKKESKSFKINAIRKVKGDSTDSGIYPFFTTCLVTRESCFHSSLCFLSSGALLQTVSHIGSLRLPALPESNLQALCMPWEHLSQHLSPWRLSTLDWEWPQGT